MSSTEQNMKAFYPQRKAKSPAGKEASKEQTRQANIKGIATRIKRAEKVAKKASKVLSEARREWLRILAIPTTRVCTLESIEAESRAEREASEAYERANDADTAARESIDSLQDERRRALGSL